jgi:hypothetical protein
MKDDDLKFLAASAVAFIGAIGVFFVVFSATVLK